MLEDYREYLLNDEKSAATIEKYNHDVTYFLEYASGNEINKSLVLAYKAELARKYALTSANSMIAALNSFLRFIGREDCCVKQFKTQKDVFCDAKREITRKEYSSLVRTAVRKKNERL